MALKQKIDDHLNNFISLIGYEEDISMEKRIYKKI